MADKFRGSSKDDDEVDPIEDSLLYYSREKMYRTMQILSVEGMKRHPENSSYKLYYCVSLIHEDRLSEAEEGLNEIQSSHEMSLACSILLKLIQNMQENIDLVIRSLAKEIEISSEMTQYFAGVVLIILNKPEKGRFFISKLLKSTVLSKKASILMAWIELEMQEGCLKDVWKYLENANNSSSEAVFGLAKYFERQGNYAKSLEYLNQAIVLFPKFAGTFIEKMKIHLALEDWEQTLSSSHRTLLLDSNNIEALRYQILHLISEGGVIEEVEEKAKSFYKVLSKCEPKNSKILCETAKLFSRLCLFHNPLLEVTLAMAKKAAELKPTDAEVNAELGFQHLCLGKHNKASALFNSHACDTSITGSVKCFIEQEQFNRALEQLQVYEECGTEFQPEMFYYAALLENHIGHSFESIIKNINNALKLHLKTLKGVPWSIKFFTLLQPYLICDICKLLLSHAPNQHQNIDTELVETLKLAENALHMIHVSCPGYRGFSSSVILANIKMLQGDFTSAKNLLYQSIDKENDNPEGHILMARLHLMDGNFFAASHCLEVALSLNFEVRENFEYLQIKAEIQKQQGFISEAVETLKYAKSLVLPDGPKATNQVPASIMNLYVQLIKIYCDLNMQDAANEAIREADSLFKTGYNLEHRVQLRFAVAYCAQSRNDIDSALSILKEIDHDSTSYFESIERRAEIQLNINKNRIEYINCYKEAVRRKSSSQTLNLLGDAFMKIQEPENAVEAYEQALKLNPKDSLLASKIGTALVKTHNFEKAVTYYKAGIKSGGQENLRYDLCALFYVIKRYKEAEELINLALKNSHGDQLSSLVMESKYLCLLSDVYSKLEMEDHAANALQKAWNVQTRVLRKVQLEHNVGEEHRKKAKDICCQLAAQASRKKDYSSAVQFYREALTFDENDTEILLSLAKLQMESHDMDAARQYCSNILNKDSNNVPAAIMLADIMFEAGDLQSAKYQFQKLLDMKPDFYEATARYIEVVRRLGKLEQAEIYLKNAEECSSNYTINPGFYYCKGLYEWYTGNTSDALKFFNKSRIAPLWGAISLYHMIEICINPENESFLSGGNAGSDEDLILKEKSSTSHESNIRTAEKLLLELQLKYGTNLNTRVFSNLIQLAKCSKSDAEMALNDFIEILTDERYKDHTAAILGSAMAYLVLKQTPRARNQLKRLAKSPWNFSDAEYLEKAWLLLADVYIKAGKLSSASEAIDKVLMFNKSCTKAFDFYGYIAERESNFQEAVKNFEKAWSLTSELNPAIGYKLAFNHMKAKQYAKAIEVSQMVLNKYPNYPKIRKEILERSRTHLRT